MGDGLWRRRFGSHPAVIGREVRLAGVVTTIVGVVDSRAIWPDGLDLWVPLPIAEMGADDLSRQGQHDLSGGRPSGGRDVRE